MAGEQQPQQEQQQPQVSQADLDALREEIKGLKSKNGEYEKLLLDPGFLEYTATKAMGSLGRNGSGKGRQTDQGDDEIDIDSMTPKQLVEYMMARINGELERRITPVARGNELAAAQRQVEAAAAKYQDFWEYKDEMLTLAKRNPALTPEEAYHIAKGTVGKKPAKPAPRTETPGGGPRASRTPEKPKGFNSAFEAAWKEAGFGASKEE